MLDNFEIHNFRTFSSLRVEKLGRVNLIVGKNNVGKTMFLEALRLHAHGGSPEAIKQLLLGCDEVETTIHSPASDENDSEMRISSLFHRGPSRNGGSNKISLGPIGDEKQTVKIEPTFLRRIRSKGGIDQSYEVVAGSVDLSSSSEFTAGLVVTMGKRRKRYLPVQFFESNRSRLRKEVGIWPAFVTARGVPDKEIFRWWDAVALHEAEHRVIESLRIISPVERINLVEHPFRRNERLVMAKLSSESSPVPLKSLGDGMSRIFQIGLAIECARVGKATRNELGPLSIFPEREMEGNRKDTLLLVDEIENGIHYTALRDLWRFILRVSKLHDVQVFATTHSWDCVRGLQEALTDTPDTDVMLIRLEKQTSTTKAVSFDAKELAIVTRDHIEVR